MVMSTQLCTQAGTFVIIKILHFSLNRKKVQHQSHESHRRYRKQRWHYEGVLPKKKIRKSEEESLATIRRPSSVFSRRLNKAEPTRTGYEAVIKKSFVLQFCKVLQVRQVQLTWPSIANQLAGAWINSITFS